MVIDGNGATLVGPARPGDRASYENAGVGVRAEGVSGVTLRHLTVNGFATGLASLLAARVLLGLGEGATFPAATSAMSRWVAKEKRGFRYPGTCRDKKLPAGTPGAVIRFRVLGRLRERGRAGVVVRRLPDEGLDVLIPDLGSAGWPQARVAPDGDWRDLGPMHLIE